MSESQMQPGWYYAQGDPPGMQRYWDGTQWQGAPQPVGQPQPFVGDNPYVGNSPYMESDYVAPSQAGIPDGLKILTIVVTVLKTIPWLLALIVTLFLAIIGGSIDEALSDAGFDGFGSLQGAVILIVVLILLFLAVGAAMLVFQLRSALNANLLGLAIIAGIMAAIDLFWAASTLAGDPIEFVSVLVMGATFIAQAVIFGWAISLYRERS